jgi:cysteine desulfurase / selenocysteine lyase
MAAILEQTKRGRDAFPVEKIRQDFPVLRQRFYDKPLVYLDNAATTQKPQAVIDRMSRFYEEEYGTVRRGVYALSERSTKAFEQARAKVARFMNAPISCEVLFTRGTTESINIVASCFGRPYFKTGDEIIISAIEHHANIVPWQQVCEATGASLKVIPVNDRGELILEEYEKMLNPNVKIVAVNHVSNALGTVNPIKWMIDKAHQQGIPVLIDGAQGVSHLPVDVQMLDCDFYAFSSHKLYGPSGIGVLYAKVKHLDKMVPYQFGGEMIETVTFEKTTFAKAPRKFEAGTPAIVEAVGLGEAIDYLTRIGMGPIGMYESELLDYATEKLSQIPSLTIVGTAEDKASVLSFTLKNIHPHDIGTILDREGVAIRAGHHCAQPVMSRYGVPATARASFAFYNTKEEIDKLAEAIQVCIKLFG